MWCVYLRESVEATISEDGWIVLKERIDMTMTSNHSHPPSSKIRNLFP